MTDSTFTKCSFCDEDVKELKKKGTKVVQGLNGCICKICYELVEIAFMEIKQKGYYDER